MGVATIDKHAFETIGRIKEAIVVQEDDEISLISSKGIVIRMDVKIYPSGANARRVHHEP